MWKANVTKNIWKGQNPLCVMLALCQWQINQNKRGDFFFLIETTSCTKICLLVCIFNTMDSFSYNPDSITSLKIIPKEFAVWSSYLCLAVCYPSFMTLFEPRSPQWESPVWIPRIQATCHSFGLSSTEHCMGLNDSPSLGGLFPHPDSNVMENWPLLLSYPSPSTVLSS